MPIVKNSVLISIIYMIAAVTCRVIWSNTHANLCKYFQEMKLEFDEFYSIILIIHYLVRISLSDSHITQT